MLPYEMTDAVSLTCAACGSDFSTKVPDRAKYCSPKCKEKSRGRRAYAAEANARLYARRMANPQTRAAYNRVARERARMIKDWLSAYKLASGCIDCGYRGHPAALDIDHVEGKTANVSELKSITAIQAEIERHKCVVRCANCHRIKSWETKTWLRAHPAVDDSDLSAETVANDWTTCHVCNRDFITTRDGRLRYHVDPGRRTPSGWAPPCEGAGRWAPVTEADEAVLAETYEPVNADA